MIKKHDFSFGNYSNLFETQYSELYASSSSEIKTTHVRRSLGYYRRRLQKITR